LQLAGLPLTPPHNDGEGSEHHHNGDNNQNGIEGHLSSPMLHGEE
jgi:hypothetical protein